MRSVERMRRDFFLAALAGIVIVGFLAFSTQLSAGESCEIQLATTNELRFSGLSTEGSVSELLVLMRSRGLGVLADQMQDRRVQILIRESGGPFRLSWKVQRRFGRHRLTFSGRLAEMSKSDQIQAVWKIVLQLSQMRNFQSFFPWMRPFWSQRQAEVSSLVEVSPMDLADRALEYFLIEYPSERRDAQIEDMARADRAIYSFRERMQNLFGVKLELRDRDPGRPSRLAWLSFFLFRVSTWAGRRHEPNAFDQQNLVRLESVLQARFGSRVLLNWYEMNVFRLLILQALIFTPVEAYHAVHWVNFENESHLLELTAKSLEHFDVPYAQSIDRKDLQQGNEILSALEDPSNIDPQERRDDLEALVFLYEQNPRAFLHSRVEVYVALHRAELTELGESTR